MKKYVILILISFIVSIITTITKNSFTQNKNIKTEYEIELINQTDIKVYSVSNDTIYYTTKDSLLKTIDLDNL